MKKKIFISVLLAGMLTTAAILMSSSHREAPLISNDPLADNTDLYVFRSPENDNTVTIIANFIPFQLPHGGPNYYHFGENIRYEIHIDNNTATAGDDITYRFTFKRTNEDPTTFFNIRLGKENLKTTYTLEKITSGGTTTIITNGKVPAYNIGPRSIESGVGLGASGGYKTLMDAAITTASSGEKVFAGPVDDPFFVDLGGIFDLGDAPRTTSPPSRDGVKCKNVSTIALQIPISALQKDGKTVSQAANILDGDFIIGVWASASRRSMKTLNADGTQTYSGSWVQVSRIGMPLTNEAVIPIGYKDYWNSLSAHQDLSKLSQFGNFFYNPELALYMDERPGFFGGAVPSFAPLDIQVGFRNGEDGLFGLKNTAALDGTALGIDAYEDLLLPGPGKPRSVDLWPIFHTGVPNLRPYQLATGKMGNPLAEGKPFINNFLPNGGDMLRLNMAVPVTPRNDPQFSTLGLVQAAVLGLTTAPYNTNSNLEFIPNMDGFPNGRRLEDDVTRIELQAVSGIVLRAIGIPYADDATRLGQVLGYTTQVEANDVALQTMFPYEAEPHSGTGDCSGEIVSGTPSAARRSMPQEVDKLGIAAPEVFLKASPNPFVSSSTIQYHVATTSNIRIVAFDASGKMIKVLADRKHLPGTYTLQWNAANMTKGTYYITTIKNGSALQSLKVVKQ